MIDMMEALKRKNSKYEDKKERLPDSKKPAEGEAPWKLESYEQEGRAVQGRHPKLHPLVAVSDLAFNEHFHVGFKPDDFLFPLLTQLATLRNFGEAGKSTAKLQLTVRRDDFALGKENNPWNEIFTEFSVQIRKHVGDEEASLYDPQFSTTKWLQRCGYDVALMDAYQSTFSYYNMFCCGIPSVSLYGTAEDWKKFQTHAIQVVKKMVELGASQDWQKDIIDKIDQIVLSAQGKASKKSIEFWMDFYQWKTHSG